ncbi:carbonic anhydrase [Emericellopsis cladophorae]|uniref:Carbonic anhydrase n=1 Tax=Emericellopsis cladophorae TaxID=2686198 RepID=A0A9Q0BAS6_9HYPO|nr:carbonic anhydrase [Emericellopsis cladophorae]KAI6778567.1 carbonic anhydrase [Emericellopsis cladophorae]
MSNSVAPRIESANKEYASKFEKINIGPAPTHHVLVLTCMDARLDVFRMLGRQIDEADVICNGGGRVHDALRSIICSLQLLETREIILIHHTDCGFTHVNEEELRSKIRKNMNHVADYLALMSFTDVKQSVLDDIHLLKNEPLVMNVPITGYVYHTEVEKLGRIQQ